MVRQLSKLLKRRTSVNHLYQAACLVLNPSVDTAYNVMLEVNIYISICSCFVLKKKSLVISVLRHGGRSTSFAWRRTAAPSPAAPTPSEPYAPSSASCWRSAGRWRTSASGRRRWWSRTRSRRQRRPQSNCNSSSSSSSSRCRWWPGCAGCCPFGSLLRQRYCSRYRPTRGRTQRRRFHQVRKTHTF